MRTINLGSSGLEVPVIAVGCMRINKIEKSEAAKFVKTALDLGAIFFDHADVYGNGECEEIFAEAIGMTAKLRETIFLQSKCGIRRGVAFDVSRDHIPGTNGTGSTLPRAMCFPETGIPREKTNILCYHII